MITVLGLGFVGLTTALGFAEKGEKVFGYDVDAAKTASLKNGHIPFHEEGLDAALAKHQNANFVIVDDVQQAIRESDVIFLCVGTPQGDNGAADLKYIFSAIDMIAEAGSSGAPKIVVVKSTVPPGTAQNHVLPYIERKNLNVHLASNPEFLREGCAYDDFMNPDRVVIGCDAPHVESVLTKLYEPFKAPVHFVSLSGAEFIKYLSNTLLSTMISYANEMSMIADAIGNIDVARSFKILHEDKRWSGNPANMASYAYPGCGFGGYCLPKDTAALAAAARQSGVKPDILDSVLATNARIKAHWIDKIAAEADRDKPLVVLGLSFKPNSDDVRQTPSYDIIKGLLDKGFKTIHAYDPLANEAFKNAYDLPLVYHDDLSAAVESGGTVVILTAWPEFAAKKNVLKGKKVFNLRYMRLT